MKRSTWLTVVALLLACSGFAAAQCAGNANPGGYDLLQTFSGTQDDLTDQGLGVVTFTGVPLPRGVAGTADTVVCRKDPLPGQLPATINIQVVALNLKGDATYQNQHVTVYARINQTQIPSGGWVFDPITELNIPDQASLSDSNGSMTVNVDGTFSSSLTIQADLIVVNDSGTVVTTMPMSRPDTISASGSTWSSIAPAGYPVSDVFTSGGFYVSDPGGSGAVVVNLISSRAVRASLYVLGVLFFGIALLKIRSSVSHGRLSLKPIYLLGLAAIAWFVAWRSSKLIFPTIAHAAAVATGTCAPHTVSAWINEGGTVVVHKIVTAVCTPPPAPSPTPVPSPTGGGRVPAPSPKQM